VLLAVGSFKIIRHSRGGALQEGGAEKNGAIGKEEHDAKNAEEWRKGT